MRRRRRTGLPTGGARRPLAGFAALLAGVLLVPAAAAAPALGAAPTELTLSGKGKARYGATLVLTGTLTSAGAPLVGKPVALYSGPTQAGSGTSDSKGIVRFRLKPTASASFEARFAPTTPGDAAAYLPVTSKALTVTVRPAVKVVVSTPLRAGRKAVGLPGVAVRMRGRVSPFVGEAISVRVTRRGKELKRKTVSVSRTAGGGRFAASFKLSRRGSYVVRAVQGPTAQLASARSRAKRLLIVRPNARPGSRGSGVRALQHRLAALGYVTPVNGHFDGSTSRAVLAFRKVFGMSRVTVANKAVFRRLAKGGGRFRIRYPKAGRHAEFDWSRQVLVLAIGSRPVRVVHASSGKPSTPTVFGSFRFYSKTPGYNAKGMYYSNYFVGGYAIHGYASVPTYAASHGCIRIPIATAVSVYRWVRLGMPIFVYR